MIPQFASTPFVQRLVDAGSYLGRQLAESMELPLRTYLRRLIPQERDGPPGRNLRILVHAAERYLVARGEHGIADVCDSLLRRPVIQQADHSNLLLDTETFLNNLLFHVAAREAGAPVAVSSQCSTVACLSRRDPVHGPVFLWTRGGCYQVFDHSKRQLKDSSFCALPTPGTLTIRPVEGRVPRPEHDPILGPIAGLPARDPADAYRVANAEIWKCLGIDDGVRRVAVDERMASEAIALHIEEGDGPVFRLLFDPAVRDTFLATKRLLVESPRNLAVNRAQPDFFWYRKGTQLRSVVLTGTDAHTRFVLESDGSPLPIPYEPRALVSALRAGDLYGDRILAYAVRCLLPGAVAVGGTVQQDYVDLYRGMFLEADQLEPFLDCEERRTIGDPTLTRLGGAPLLEPDPGIHQMLQWLGPATPLRDLEQLLDRPVGITIGGMDCAYFYDRLLARQRERLERAERVA